MGGVPNSMAMFYTTLFEGETRYLTGAVSYKLTPHVTVAAGIVYEGEAGLDLTGLDTNDEIVSTGTFEACNMHYVLGANLEVSPKINVGPTWTVYDRQLYTTKGGASDFSIGMKYTNDLFEAMGFGKNILGNRVVYSNNAMEELTTEYGLSVKSNPLPYWDTEIFVQAKWLSSVKEPLKSVGMKFHPLNSDILGVSMGYKEKYRIGNETHGSRSAGVTLSLAPVIFEYGYDTTDVFQQENQHYFSVSHTY